MNLFKESNFDTSAITIVDQLLIEGVFKRASDIHFEPQQKKLLVRYRVDGSLHVACEIEEINILQVIARIKIISRMDVTERRVPQDGKFSHEISGYIVDFRVSTFPSLYGEKVVIRILDRSQNLLNINELGFEQNTYNQIKDLISRLNGFFLVVGTTGSGKTTTMYSLISTVNNGQKNIITLEDPIEYNLNGITQGQVYPEINFTFARGIRSILRQDPDIIMVGEVRDKETAHVALQAALTGHLVLSTLHTMNAPATLMRLLDMGLEPFLLNAALTGVLAQNLARKLCNYCKTRTDISKHQKFIDKYNLPIENIYQSTGCQKCNGLGYKGRIGIFELLVISNKLRSSLVENPDFENIYKQAIDDGMVPLINDAALKVNRGIIGIDELIRISL